MITEYAKVIIVILILAAIVGCWWILALVLEGVDPPKN